jgi:hypothetical protein
MELLIIAAVFFVMALVEKFGSNQLFHYNTHYLRNIRSTRYDSRNEPLGTDSGRLERRGD